METQPPTPGSIYGTAGSMLGTPGSRLSERIMDRSAFFSGSMERNGSSTLERNGSSTLERNGSSTLERNGSSLRREGSYGSIRREGSFSSMQREGSQEGILRREGSHDAILRREGSYGNILRREGSYGSREVSYGREEGSGSGEVLRKHPPTSLYIGGHTEDGWRPIPMALEPDYGAELSHLSEIQAKKILAI